jgi:hypothetical protein
MMRDQLVAGSPRDTLATDGVVILRRFLSGDETAELRAVVFAVYDEMDARRPLLSADLAEHFTAWKGVWTKPLPKFLAEHDAPLLARYSQISDLICEKVRREFGETWRLYPERTYFRRHVGMALKVRWHIDADAAHTRRRHCFNLWLPLDAVGDDSPSLDIIPRSHRIMREVPLLTGEDRYRDDAFAANVGSAVIPKLVPGDAVAFDQFTLHRTQCVGTESTVRTACEFRFQSGFTMLLGAVQSAATMARRARAILPI